MQSRQRSHCSELRPVDLFAYLYVRCSEEWLRRETGAKTGVFRCCFFLYFQCRRVVVIRVVPIGTMQKRANCATLTGTRRAAPTCNLACEGARGFLRPGRNGLHDANACHSRVDRNGGLADLCGWPVVPPAAMSRRPQQRRRTISVGQDAVDLYRQAFDGFVFDFQHSNRQRQRLQFVEKVLESVVAGIGSRRSERQVAGSVLPLDHF